MNIGLISQEVSVVDEIDNFRDSSKYNQSIKRGVIYRTSNLVSYQDMEFITSFLKEENINTIIDLRADREIESNFYSKDFISNFHYLNVPFDPWNQPEWFQKEVENKLSDLSNSEKAYHFFVKGCKKEIRMIFDTILNSNGAVAIHCVAGKDRTGLIFMLIGLLADSTYNDILNDYLASEKDTTESKFKIYIDEVESYGGIEKYLDSCGIKNTSIKELKKIIKNG